MALQSGLVAGEYQFWLAKKNTNNYPMGYTLVNPDSPVNGTVYDPYLVPAIVSTGGIQPTVERATSYAGQQKRGTRVLGVSDFGELPIELSEYDEQFDALVHNYTGDETTVSGWNITAGNLGQTSFGHWIAGFVFGYTDSSNNELFLTSIYNDVQITGGHPGSSQAGGQNPNNLQYTLTLNRTPRTGLGYLYSGTALAVQDNQDGLIKITASKGIMIATYIDDGVAVTFTTGYLPTSSDVTGANNSWTKNGVDNSSNVSAYSITTGATTHTAGTATDIWVVGYESDFMPSS